MLAPTRTGRSCGLDRPRPSPARSVAARRLQGEVSCRAFIPMTNSVAYGETVRASTPRFLRTFASAPGTYGAIDTPRDARRCVPSHDGPTSVTELQAAEDVRRTGSPTRTLRVDLLGHLAAETGAPGSVDRARSPTGSDEQAGCPR